MSVLSTLFSSAVLAQIIRTAVPYALGAAGGIVTERSGVIQIGIEGLMLVGAFAGVVTEVATHSAWLGLFAAVAVGAFFGLGHGLIVALGRVHGVISGLALNLLALGGTRVLLRTLYHSTSNSPSVAGFRFLEGGGAPRTLLRALLHPSTLLAILVTLALPVLLRTTTFGLSLRAAGDDPVAARALGVRVRLSRSLASALGGALGGLAGASLALDQHQFQSGMTSGRGFIAIAIAILSAWNIRKAALYALFFAVLDACQILFQGAGQTLGDALTMLPFAVALVTLATTLTKRGGGLNPPRGLGVNES